MRGRIARKNSLKERIYLPHYGKAIVGFFYAHLIEGAMYVNRLD